MYFFSKGALPLFAAALALPSSVLGQDALTPATPSDAIAVATPGEWIRINPADLMVMDLAPGPAGKPRRVVIQLMPAPFSQGWVGNIRKLVAAHWFDGIAVVRVQDNYVVQWGDPDGETDHPKALPEDLKLVPQSEYMAPAKALPKTTPGGADAYASRNGFVAGWPIAGNDTGAWPVHCYGMVGVGRNLSPDTGTGAELYTVIGQAPRQLDRNIALVGRIIAGMENLTSLPRGTGEMGFYETPEERTAIAAVRFGSQVPDLPAYEYLSTSSASFARYVQLRANRKDDFYITPAGGVDLCNVPVPIRAVGAALKRAGM